MKRFFDNMPLKWKIFGFLLGFCGLLLVILWVFQTVLLNDMYKVIRRREMEQTVVQVRAAIDSEDLQTLLTQIEQERAIFVTPSDGFTPPPEKQLADKQPRDGFEKNRRMQESLTATKEFQKADGTTVSMTFHAIITPVDATVNTLRYQLYIITGVMILMAVLLALLIARHVARPIEEISESAKLLGTGQYDVRFQGKGYREIGALSSTLTGAADELSRVEALRRELLANVSHDLRTPLSLIYSYAEMMQDFPGEITPEQPRVIMSEAARLTGLVNDMLDISRLESGGWQLCCKPYNLTESLTSTVNRLSALLEREGYQISFTPDSQVTVVADEGKITQAVYNLLVNGVNYAGERRQVEVVQQCVEASVLISVIDYGEGIPQSQLPMIWERYYKSGKAHRRAVTGTGLGLSIVKRVVELHGGRYGVESTLGEGSRFWIEIPKASKT